MTLTVLSVAYPFAPVGPDAVGGAEQILSALDRALVRAGHTSLVIAVARSSVAGVHVALAPPPEPLDEAAWHVQHERIRRAVRGALECWPVDVVHMHGADFHAYLPPAGVPTLVTLHLPPAWYPADALWPTRPDTHLVSVSQSQQRECPPSPALLSPIPNGVPVARLAPPPDTRKWGFAVALGRLCPEKGFHHALDAAAMAGVPLLLAGRLDPYPTYEAYFRDEIAPRLDRRRRLLGPVGFAWKRRLLARARCLLVPSVVSETSSLVAMEALACGTPVVAFAAGALPEIVEHGRTGFIVHDTAEMADAIRACPGLDSRECLRAARERFSEEVMVARYLDCYERLARRETTAATTNAPEPEHARA